MLTGTMRIGVEERLDDGGPGGEVLVGLSGSEADSGGGVVFAVHPSDGHEVGELPDEEDGEESDGGPLDDAARGGPADEWRRAPGKAPMKVLTTVMRLSGV